MKIAVIYNRDSQAVINLFGAPSREKYGLQTIEAIVSALREGGHRVKAFEGDKNVIGSLEEFMPSVISGERPGLVFNLSYGIQGRARYTHIPGILEMLGIPYVGSGPETHTVALDKVLTKTILLRRGLPTPRFTILDRTLTHLPREEGLSYPLILKPRGEALSLGLTIVHNDDELREGVAQIERLFQAPSLVEEYIAGREFNVALLGNDPPSCHPPVEIIFQQGPGIFTYEDKLCLAPSRLVKECPAQLDNKALATLQTLALEAYRALGCYDGARVDFRQDDTGEFFILEVNTLPSLEPAGSYVQAAAAAGLNYNALINRLIEIASHRYFGPAIQAVVPAGSAEEAQEKAFTFLTRNRDSIEEELAGWTNLGSRTEDPVGKATLLKKLEGQLDELGLKPVETYTDRRAVWTWQTSSGMHNSSLFLIALDVPSCGGGSGYPLAFRREPEWLYGEGIASSRAGITVTLQTLHALKAAGRLMENKIALLGYADEGRGLSYSGKMINSAAAQAARVFVMQPGLLGGGVIEQRRGARRYSLRIEGEVSNLNRGGGLVNWFLERAVRVTSLSREKEVIHTAVREITTDSFSIYTCHRIRAIIEITFMDAALADQVEGRLKKLFTLRQGDSNPWQVHLERIVDRPALRRSPQGEMLTARLRKISESWKLPFSIHAAPDPSAAGEVPPGVAVICGCAPAGRDIHTPYEAVNRGELLQRSLLLALFHLQDQSPY